MNDFKIGRNELCFCGSGLKYKKCCLQREPKDYEKKNWCFP
ncbi:MAG: SEC-C domain-containing protein [Oligoflexia bacterium]|nr:SEC-C domain-containing protein [Oligoflexia bacterium]